MLEYLGEPSWSPYFAGAGIGLLACGAFLLSDHPLGCSTGYVKITGIIERVFRRGVAERIRYYQVVPPAIDWQLMIVPGIVIGAFISSTLSNTFQLIWVPVLWGTTFGFNPLPRIAVAITGGILLETGSRWEGGCTCGHGISGTLQLALSSITAATCFLIGGILTAMVLFTVTGG